MATAAETADGIPVIDVSRDDELVAKEIVDAFKTIGFATLINHGVDDKIIQSAFASSKTFFDLPVETKNRYKYEGHESNRGYIGMGGEAFAAAADKKETFDIGNELETTYKNRWPTEDLSEKFRSDMLTYYDTFDALHLRIMKLIAIGLKLPDEDYLVDRCNGRHENLRLLHYRPVDLSSISTSDESDPISRCAVHTDYGTITLLTQDSVGGLRAQRVDGTWVYVPPVPGSIVVNVGDMLQMWTNDVLRATPHQVVENRSTLSPSGIIPERYSIAFFCNASKDVMLECIEQCTSDERPARHKPINAHEYITSRLSQTISTEKAN